MPDLPKYHARITPKPVGKAPLPVGAADIAGGAKGAGLGAIGKGVSDLGNVLAQIKREQIAASDSINEARADALIRSKKDDFDNYTSITPLSIKEGEASNWEKQLEDTFSELQKSTDLKIDLSKKARGELNARLLTEKQLLSSKLRLKQTLTLQRESRAARILAIEEAIKSGDDLQIGLALKKFDNRRTFDYGPNQAAADEALKNAKRDGMIERLQGSAVLEPEKTLEIINTEIKARKKGEDQSELLTEMLPDSSDLKTLADYTRSILNKRDTESENAMNASIEDGYGQIIKGVENIKPILDAIQADPSIKPTDSNTAIDKITTFFSKHNALVKASEESSELIYDRLVKKSEAVERGALSPIDFEEDFANLKRYLTDDDQRDLRSKDVVATKTMQNRAFTDATAEATPVLVERTETEMGAMIIARTNAEQIKDLDRVNFFNIAVKKNQAQRWNNGRFRKQLRSQISQNPEWSQSQIFVAQEVLLDQLDIPVGDLLVAFDGANPNRAITKTAPHKEFEDIWSDLSLEDKSLIWSELMAGTPVGVLLNEVKK